MAQLERLATNTRSSALIAVLVTVLLNLLASLSFAVISLTTPAIGRSLGATAQDELWLTDAYLIALVATTLLSGVISARLGRKGLLLLSTLGLSLTSTLGSVAGDFTLLTLLCFVMGAFSGMIAPTTQTLIADAFGTDRRGSAMALWGAGTTLGLLVGALASGFDHTSWRPVFLVCAPLGLLALPFIGALKAKVPEATTPGRLDVTGVGLLLVALLSFGCVLNVGDTYGWLRSPIICLALLLAVVAAALFYRHYRSSPSARRTVDFAALQNQQFAGAVATALGVAAFSTGQFQIDLLGGPLHLSPELISLRSALGAVALLVGVLTGGQLLALFGALPTVSGALLVALVGKYAFTLYGPGLSDVAALWPQLVSGFGLGILGTALAVVAYSTLEPRSAQAGASLFVLSSQLGSALGLAFLGIALDFFEVRAAATLGATGALTQPFLEVFWLEFCGTVLCLGFTLLLYQRKARYAGTE